MNVIVVNWVVTLANVDLPLLRVSRTFKVEHTISPVVGSVAQVVIVALPPGLAKARAQTVYPAEGFGSSNRAPFPSHALPSSTAKVLVSGASCRYILFTFEILLANFP